jgi:heat shock protein HslJ
MPTADQSRLRTARIAASRLATALALAALAGPAGATADGPDVFGLREVAPGATVEVRAGPGPEHGVIGSLRSDADGIVNFGCRGGLSLMEWESASDAERAAAVRWCRVGHGELIGWVDGRRLAESAAPPEFRGGARLATLAGSEWQLRDITSFPISQEAWIGFRSDGAVVGNAGCNGFRGNYEEAPGELSLGPLAMTRMACPEPAMRLERAMARILSDTRETVASHLLLGLFDGEGVLLATFYRRDAD